MRGEKFTPPTCVRSTRPGLAFTSFTSENRIVQALQLLFLRRGQRCDVTLGTDRCVVRLATTTGESEES